MAKSKTQSYKMFINGSWVEASSGARFDVINPATEEAIANVPKGGADDTRAAIDAARDAFDKGAWSEKTHAERATLLWRLSDLFEKRLLDFAHLESINVGKTIKYSRDSDMPFIIDNLRFFSGAARTLEGKASAEYSGMGTSIIRREPIGVVGAIVPWNYPLYIAVWKLAPALAAGNTLVMKPASLTPLTLLEFAKLTEQAGLPRGVLNIVTGPGEIVGEELAKNGKVDMVGVTGDTNTGKKIMQLASTNVKKVHLELGGKAPFIVLPDANLDAAAKGAVVAAFWNTAQDCTAATRIYVHKSIHGKFMKLLLSETRKIRIGNPLSEKTDMGPLVSAKQREATERYVLLGIEQGARLVHGGKRPKTSRGFFFEPTIFDGVDQRMRICREEIFGPVLSVLTFSDVDEVIEKANDVIYGLASSVWGKDMNTTMKIARKLRFGTVWINEHGILTSEMPHGGFKQSGFGKDLSMYSLEDYTQIKHVYIDQTGLARKPWHYVVYGDKE